MMGDHYNPLNKELVLSPDVFEGRSTAAVGIAAHECGHAIQHQEHYLPLQLRMTAVGATSFANRIVMVLPFLFIFTHSFVVIHGALVALATAWGIIMLFNLVTLPVEFDASRRAKIVLPAMGIIRGPAEMQGVNKVLDAAALTYVAAFLTTLGYFLYYAMMLLGGQRR
jgi:Zn-dependent membrane protease YugP